MPELVKTKKRCCKSGPRCKKCPVVWHRLAQDGVAERKDKRSYVPGDISKKQMKAARAR